MTNFTKTAMSGLSALQWKKQSANVLSLTVNCPEAIISANVPETSCCPLSKEEIGNQLIQQTKLTSVHDRVLFLEHQQSLL